jgi:hypothetical protein
MLIRVALGRTINLGGFQSLRVDIAHEVAIEDHPDRAAAVAEAVRLCRDDLAAIIAAETASRDAPRDAPRDLDDDGIEF